MINFNSLKNVFEKSLSVVNHIDRSKCGGSQLCPHQYCKLPMPKLRLYLSSSLMKKCPVKVESL